jgi:hypothetical protein
VGSLSIPRCVRLAQSAGQSNWGIGEVSAD